MPPKLFKKLDLSKITCVASAVSTPAHEVERVELIEDSTYDQFMLESATYSITPRAFVERVLLYENDDFSKFVDEYSNGFLYVRRFGINLNSIRAEAEIKKVNDNLLNKPKKSKSVSSNIPTSSSIADKIDQIKQQRLDAQSRITLLEKDCICAAINYLNAPNSYNVFPVVVLVDVLKRTDDGVTQANIHTVVLFSQGGKYLVIDPSNCLFSHVITGASDYIRLCFSKKCKIYSPKSNDIGPNSNQWRDCIDIAVKIAFNIQANLKMGILMPIQVHEYDKKLNIGEIDFVSLKDSMFVREITNNDDLYSKTPGFFTVYTARLKQSSDVKETKKVTACMKVCDVVATEIKKRMETLDLYHSYPLLEKKIHAFHNKVNMLQQYSKFQHECLTFIKELSSSKIISCLEETEISKREEKTEAEALLELELRTIDKLFGD